MQVHLNSALLGLVIHHDPGCLGYIEDSLLAILGTIII